MALKIIDINDSRRFQSKKDADQGTGGKPAASAGAVLGNLYIYGLSFYNLGNLLLAYTDITTTPFYFNSVYGAGSAFLSTFLLLYSVGIGISTMCWQVNFKPFYFHVALVLKYGHIKIEAGVPKPGGISGYIPQ